MTTLGCGDAAISATYWQRLRCYLRPSTSAGYRDLIALIMIGEGLIRSIDGLVFPTPAVDYLASQLWGIVEALLGILLFATRSCRRRAQISGRLAASVACGFCVAFAFAVFHSSAPSAFVHVCFAVVLALEAQVSECK